MKKLLMLVMTIGLFSASAFAQNPCNPCNPKAGKTITKATGRTRTLVGYIADSQCGLSHQKMQEAGNMGNDDKTCTLKCVEMGGKFVLADRGRKVIYTLDEESQAKAREFAGQKVKITGQVDSKAKTIHVVSIAGA
ncbi:MAG TPA: hypothetical protein VJM12_00420 [Pyrinomonadaceae bacterium]|nr:hypothetical protein [Pyrinomonadaceae bacterium]